MDLLSESGMAEIEIKEGEESVRISRYGDAPQQIPMHIPAPQMQAPVASPVSETPVAVEAPALILAQVLLPTIPSCLNCNFDFVKLPFKPSS